MDPPFSWTTCVGRHTRRSHSPEEDCVMLAKLVESTIGNVFPCLLVPLRAPVVVGELKLKGGIALSQNSEDCDSSGDDLRPNPITADCGDAIVSAFGGGALRCHF